MNDIQPKDRTLEITVTDDQLVMTIGLDCLVNAVTAQPAWPPCGEDGEACKVLDRKQFIADLVHELQREAEDGTTLVHEALDSAAIAAVENGSEAVEYGD